MEAVAQSSGRARALHALRSRDFRLLWAGQTISLVGDGAFLVALGWKSFSLTGSKSTLALVLMAHGTAMLATLLIGGALADRYPRRTLMIISDVARLVVMVVLAAVDATGHLNIGILVALALCYGLGDGFFYPAFGGIIPLVVDQHHIASANALIGLSRQGAFVAGPALAGGLYGLAGSSSVFAFNAVSFAVAAALMLAARPRAIQPEPPKGTFREIADGIRFVVGVPWLWISIFLASFILMIAMAPYTALLPAFVEEQYGRGVGAYGALFTLQSLGMAIGSIVFGQVNPRGHRVVIMYLLFALNDVFVVAMALTHQFELGLFFVFCRGLCIGFGLGVWNTLMMQFVPESKLARVSSLDFFGSFALVPVGYALTALVAGLFAPSSLLIAGFTLSAFLWTAPLALRRVREDRMRSPEEILRDAKTIALVGASPNPAKPSHGVMRYLLAQGYRVIPMRPADCDEVLGVPCVQTLADIDEPIDLVDVFRRPEHTPQHAREAVEVGAKALWLQLGIRSEEARRIATEGGLDYVEDLCTAVVHRNLG